MREKSWLRPLNFYSYGEKKSRWLMTHIEIVKDLAGVCEGFLKHISIQMTY
jgi:hypothetical protein